MSLMRIDHVQITAPRHRRDEVRHFYGRVLGLTELDGPRIFPPAGLWFAFQDSAQLHVMLVENPFRPPVGDHVAVVVGDMKRLMRRLGRFGIDCRPSPGRNGYDHVFVQDPFGNRLELLATNGNGGSNG